MNALALLYVAVGGAVGAMGRHLVQSLFMRGDFPLGTFVINILGGLLLGAWIATVVYYLPEKGRDLHLLLAVGVLGGFTTFSTFTMEAYLLIERGQLLHAVTYVAGSVFLSLLAFFIGMWMIKLVAA